MTEKQDEIRWTATVPGAERRILAYDDSLMMVEFRFERGAEGPPHSHSHVQTTYVASGRFEFILSGELHILEAGDALLIPSNAVHSCVALEAGSLIDAFTPHRKDFL